jgi:hypothetical protein
MDNKILFLFFFIKNSPAKIGQKCGEENKIQT